MNAPATATPVPPAGTDTVLAFDVGTRRIGVAVGECAAATAHGIATVSVLRSGPDWRRVAEIVEEWEPAAFVVGLPLSGDGSETASSRLARRFGGQLRARFARPVHWADERLSSDAAEAMLRETGRRGHEPGCRDRVAAQLILQTWLNQRDPRP